MEFTIKDLKALIKDLPDDMLVGGSGHFGEFLSCHDARVETVDKSYCSNETIKILTISIENPGPDPD